MPEAENIQKTHFKVFSMTFLWHQNFGPKNRIVCTSFGLSSMGHVIYFVNTVSICIILSWKAGDADFVPVRAYKLIQLNLRRAYWLSKHPPQSSIWLFNCNRVTWHQAASPDGVIHVLLRTTLASHDEQFVDEQLIKILRFQWHQMQILKRSWLCYLWSFSHDF